MTAAVVDAEASAVVATAADIICSLRGADLAGWTPPWRKPDEALAAADPSDGDALVVAWPAATRGKRSRSRRGSSPSTGSGSTGAKAKTAEKKARRARGSPPSPLDYSAGSGASTSGGEDGAFCSPPVVLSSSAPGGGGHAAEPVNSKVGLPVRRSILPVPPPRPAGQRPRKKMRLPEIQQMVRSLSVENDALRQEMKALQKACTALSKENGKLETRLDQTSKRDEVVISDEKKGKQKHGQRAAQSEAQNGFALPDLNLPAQDG
ncbi:hypothetical protein PR202_ga14817 [Eleusine coracana subsp. coracana]|uniref:BZIP domain-containing protein n=1 Tax=Eleusine coracana subsp. coracana TaxID=191504 RepID=A0AAV5CI75_ELECO|nr:hypothetical protein PR202_ga14817 [Eleusine coracana subsp. coracana]